MSLGASKAKVEIGEKEPVGVVVTVKKLTNYDPK